MCPNLLHCTLLSPLIPVLQQPASMLQQSTLKPDTSSQCQPLKATHCYQFQPLKHRPAIDVRTDQIRRSALAAIRCAHQYRPTPKLCGRDALLVSRRLTCI
uniref:Secreted RxLR effector peptide protein n=1 Tax=Phytophthora infestans TaxID=4787 RepID=Q572H6_PHYIN|nr:hypothetical protein PI49.0070 [Phytophthora infestans]